MKLYWYYDAFRHTCLNGEGKDYTPAYLPLLLKNSGYSVERLPAERLSSLVAGDVLLLGAEVLSEEQSAALQVALSRGCAVIAFGAVAAGVFPEFTREIGNEDVYNVLGYFRFSGGEEPLPVLGSAGVLAPEAGEILGGLTEADGAFCPLYVRLGERVWYWSFDLPGSLWRAADGRPTTEGKNGFSLGRIPDGYVVGPGHNYSVAYADSYMRCLEEILSGAGFPRFYPLPVREGMPCDLALYFGGDDDATSSEIDLKAAANMRERGLPYHLNLMPMDEEGHFRLTREQVQQLHEGGCETAIHYNFLMFPYSDEGHRVQSEMYERAFGEVSVGPVNHCLIQHGSAAERYRMEAENGALGDNSRFQIEPDAKDVNAFNLTGFASGTAFPRFVLCDAAHGNRPLKFCEVAMSYYEPRIRSGLPEEYRKIRSEAHV